MQEFNGKTAFITGGASGIGFGIAKTFARQGMNVVIGDVQDDRLKHAEGLLKEITKNIFSVNVDVTDREALHAVSDKIKSVFGTLHVLCNNAGRTGGGKVLDTPEDRWRHVEEVNFW